MPPLQQPLTLSQAHGTATVVHGVPYYAHPNAPHVLRAFAAVLRRACPSLAYSAPHVASRAAGMATGDGVAPPRSVVVGSVAPSGVMIADAGGDVDGGGTAAVDAQGFVAATERHAGALLRVGFVSGDFRSCTMGRLLGGVVAGLASPSVELLGFGRFNITLIATPHTADAVSLALQRVANNYVLLPAHPASARMVVESLQLDVLV